VLFHRSVLTLAAFTLMVGCADDFPEGRAFAPAVEEPAARFPVEIHQPTTLGVVDTRRLDVQGRPIGVSCDTCHGPNPTDAWVAEDGAPATFHEKVQPTHGSLSCDSCHDQDRTKLHLADGKILEMGDVRVLCAQCHGVQHRDYVHGSHGGMTGYWDTRRGPRSRNLCVDCHAPHAPQYPMFLPVHPPRDRYLPSSAAPEVPHE
jgi:Zn finger protein HypA/HybF involved in hydrogenase expression